MADTYSDFQWFWMFYEREIQGDRKTTVVRPFYLKSGTRDTFFQASLMPVLFWRYRDPLKDDWRWLFSFGSAVRYTHSDGTREFDFGFFPLLFFGMGAEDRDKYFFFWPFGGTLKGKFATDKISAYLFPGFLLFVFFPPAAILSYQTLFMGIASLLPVFSTFENRGFKAWSILWPMIYWGKGNLREELRIFPFYAHLHKRGWYDKFSLLMIFNYHTFYFKDDLHQMFFLFPLFGRKWSRSGRLSGVTILWPLFSWGYDKRIGDRQLNVPWPLIQIQDCTKPEIKKRIFFPIYGYYRYISNVTIFVTPLYFQLRKKSVRFDSVQHISFAIFWFFKRDYHKEPDPYYGKQWRFFKIWPLFSLEYNDRGDSSFNLLSLLPFRDREGYEKMYQPFWSLFEFEKFSNGEKRFGLILRTFYQRWSDSFYYLRVPLVFSIGRRKGRLTELSLLLYLFGYKARGTGRYLRLFWIPIRIGDTDPELAVMAAEEEREAAKRDSLSGHSYLLIHRPADRICFTSNF